MSLQATQDESTRRRRPHHAGRTAESHAAFLLPHLRPGMALLDLGCGPGSITMGLAAAVAPGETTGIDVDPAPVDGVTVVAGDVQDLPFPDDSFDAIFASAVLQHVPDPLAALREARRVARPGAVIGIVDADWDGELFHPSSDVLRRSMEIARKLREGTSPYVGKQLRHLLTEAGFVRAEGYARVVHHGTVDEVRGVSAFTASHFRYPAAVDRAVAEGWATAEELEEMSRAWTAWGEQPGAFLARFWCEAIGWAE
jgi:SAM-dependent methyltransferase